MKRLFILLAAMLLLHTAQAQCAMQDINNKHVFHLAFNSTVKGSAKLTLADSRGTIYSKSVKVNKGYNTAALYVRDIDRNPYFLRIASTGTGINILQITLTNNFKP